MSTADLIKRLRRLHPEMTVTHLPKGRISVFAVDIHAAERTLASSLPAGWVADKVQGELIVHR